MLLRLKSECIQTKEGERMETAAFTAAAEQYQDMVYRIALSHLGNDQDAEDAVQEVFLKLYR